MWNKKKKIKLQTEGVQSLANTLYCVIFIINLEKKIAKLYDMQCISCLILIIDKTEGYMVKAEIWILATH